MDKKYYKEYFSLERSNWWFIVRGKIIADNVKKYIYRNKPLKILNIGAATGRTSQILDRFGEVSSVEYDKDCADYTSRRLGIEIINASITDLPFENDSFDLVCGFDVIEHVEDDKKAISEMARVCKPHGFIFITVPALMSLWGHHDEINHHYRRYRIKELANLLGTYRGKIFRKTYFNSFLFPPIYLFRLISKLIPDKIKREGSGSDFSVIKQDSFLNKINFALFNSERKILKILDFPLGVSIILIWRKRQNT